MKISVREKNCRWSDGFEKISGPIARMNTTPRFWASLCKKNQFSFSIESRSFSGAQLLHSLQFVNIFNTSVSVEIWD